MKKLIYLFIMVMLVSGCACMGKPLISRTNELRLGMTKDEVISILGEPVSTQANIEEGERLEYWVSEHFMAVPYSVTIKDGKVVKYGR